MKLRTLSEIASQRLQRLPSDVTKNVGEALIYAHEQVFGRALWRGKRLKPISSLSPKPVLPALLLPAKPASDQQLTVKPALSRLKSVSSIDTPPISPIVDHVRAPSLRKTPPKPSIDAVLVPVLPQEVDESPKAPTGDQTFISNHDSFSLGSEFSQRTTEMTNDLQSFDEAAKRKTKGKRPKKVTSNADLELVKKMNEEWEKKQQVLAAKQKEQENSKLMEKRKALLEAEIEKRRILEERRAKIIAKRELAQKEKQTSPNAHKRSLSVLPLHKRLENEFKSISEMEELEYQRKLKAIKDFMQPIEMDSLLKHKEWYESQRERLRKEKEMSRDNKNEEILRWNLERKYYKAKALDVLEEERQAQLLAEEVKSSLPKQLHLKQREYASLVQELHKPSVSSKPSTAAKSDKRTTKTANHSPNLSVVEEKRSKKRFPSVTNRSPKREKSLDVSVIVSSREKTPAVKPVKMLKLRSKSPKKSTSEATISEKQHSERYNNYLRPSYDLSSHQRQLLLAYRSNRRLQTKSCSLQELKDEAEKLGKRARRNEGMMKRLSGDVNTQIDACDSVSAMYIDSIRAKLQLLNAVGESSRVL